MHTASLYRYLCAGALRLVALLCVTALAWWQSFLVRCRTLPGVLQGRLVGRRLIALCTLLWLLTLLMVSGPHLVHHFADLSPQHDHHTHSGSAHPPPECVVFLVMQHTPLAAGVLAYTLIPHTSRRCRVDRLYTPALAL